MTQLERIIPYELRIAKAVVVDVADALSNDATRDKDTGQIIATVRVFDNESRVAFETKAIDESKTNIRITLISPSPQLSEDGQKRLLGYLVDSMEQLLENAFWDADSTKAMDLSNDGRVSS